MTPEEKIKQQKREWYYRNKDKVLEQQKNSEKKKVSQKLWYSNNKESCIKRAKVWNRENEGARKLINDRYIKRKDQVWGNHPKE